MTLAFKIPVLLFLIFAVRNASAQNGNLNYLNKIEARHVRTVKQNDSILNAIFSIEVPHTTENMSRYNDLLKQERNTVPIRNKFEQLNDQYGKLYDTWAYTIINYNDYDHSEATAALNQMRRLINDMESSEFELANILSLAKLDAPLNMRDLQTKNLQNTFSSIFALNENDGSKLFELSISLPFQGTPVYADNTTVIISNQGGGATSNYSSKQTAVNFFGLKVEPVLRVINSNYIKLLVYGSASYSNTVIFGDVEGGGADVNGGVTYYDYTYGGELSAGAKLIKVLGEYQGGYRHVDYSNGSTVSGPLNSTISSAGIAGYNFVRYGAGLNFRLNSDGTAESYLKLKCYYEKPQYAQKALGYSLSLKYLFDVTVEYSPDYPVSGPHSYPVNNTGSKQDFWFVGIGKTIGF